MSGTSSVAIARRIALLARPELRRIGVGIAATAVSSALALAVPAAMQWGVDGALGGDVAVLNGAAGALGAVLLLHALTAYVRSVSLNVAGERIVARLRKRLYAAILCQDTEVLEGKHPGDLTSRLLSDTTVLRHAATETLSATLQQTAMAIGAAVLLVSTSPRLALITCVLFPAVVAVAVGFGRKARRLARRIQDNLAASAKVSNETLGLIRTVRAFGRERYERRRYDDCADAVAAVGSRWARVSASFHAAALLASAATLIGVLWFGARLVAAEQLTAGNLLAALMYVSMVSVSLGGLASSWADLMKVSGASQRIFALLDGQPRIEAQACATPPRTGSAPVVRFRDVDFRYPSRPDAPVLRALNLTLTPGRMTALVGRSGAGKSTVADLMCRFYDPCAGSIEVDGRALAELDLNAWRKTLGIVRQDVALFDASILDNIRYGRATASDAEVRAVAELANVDEFAAALPDGYATKVGALGQRLSVGQRQRVAIARALLRDPALVILDEATSALDAESEYHVQQALDRLIATRTSLVIAHRLSTVRRADRVAVLDGGRIVDTGTHAQLIGKAGPYRDWVALQEGRAPNPSVTGAA